MVDAPENRLHRPEQDLEYTEVNAYLRHYSSLRFVMVSVYFAVSAAVVAAAFGLVPSEGYASTYARAAFRVIGLGVTATFFAYEWRLEGLIRYYQRKSRDLEDVLPCDTMKGRPRPFVSALAPAKRSKTMTIIGYIEHECG